MKNQPAQHTHTGWRKTIVAANNRRRAKPATAIKRATPAAKPAAEKEADRWVAEMMFDHYNG